MASTAPCGALVFASLFLLFLSFFSAVLAWWFDDGARLCSGSLFMTPTAGI